MNPVVALIIANAIWGAASPIFKYALTDIPPFTLAFVRFYFAGLLLLPFIKIDQLKRATKKDWTEIFLASMLGIVINISFFFLALQKTDSINAPIIASSGPLFLFLFSVLFLKEKPEKKVFEGMSIAFIGACVIIFAPVLFVGKQVNIGQFEGNVMLVIATLASVAHPVILKKVLQKIDALTVTAVSFLLSSVPFALLMSRELQHWDFSQLHIAGWTGIIFGVFLSSALAYYLYHYALSRVPAQETGIFTYIDPITAILIAAPLVHEFPDITFIAGSIFIFTGIYIAEGRIPHHLLNYFRRRKQ